MVHYRMVHGHARKLDAAALSCIAAQSILSFLARGTALALCLTSMSGLARVTWRVRFWFFLSPYVKLS